MVPVLSPESWERVLPNFSLSFKMGHVFHSWVSQEYVSKVLGQCRCQLAAGEAAVTACHWVAGEPEAAGWQLEGLGTSPTLSPSLRTSYVLSWLVSPLPSQLKIWCTPHCNKCFKSVHMAYGLHLSLIHSPPWAVFPDALCSVQWIRMQTSSSVYLYCKQETKYS